MAARRVDLIIPDERVAEALELISTYSRRSWREVVEGDLEKISCIVQPRRVEALLSDLEGQFGTVRGFLVLVSPLEATLPRMTKALPSASDGSLTERAPTTAEAFFSRDRISTNELYDDIESSVDFRFSYLLTVVLSTLIAALAMRSGQTAIVIGAMVIAPLLGPTMAMALAATVNDRALAFRSIRTLAAGVAGALAAGALLGAIIDVDPAVPELLSRTVVQPADIALALASGTAGVLALSQGASLSLVGVMIAVALVPPLAAAGLLWTSGYAALSLSALFLFLTNLVCINVAGIITFLAQGLTPKDWRITGRTLSLWLLILALLIALVVTHFTLGVASMEVVRTLLPLALEG